MFCCFVDCVSLALKSPYGERSTKYVLYCIVCIWKSGLILSQGLPNSLTKQPQNDFRHYFCRKNCKCSFKIKRFHHLTKNRSTKLERTLGKCLVPARITPEVSICVLQTLKGLFKRLQLHSTFQEQRKCLAVLNKSLTF